jgi:alpha-methylacyl-CoA racemase
VRVVELAAPGPVPFAAMMLADLGADVIRIDRPGDVDQGWARRIVTTRSRRSVVVDLKQSRGLELVAAILSEADVLLEGYRPGVAERLGLGDATLRELNPRLVVGRVSAWGQTGPDAAKGGFDLSCLAESGVLSVVGGDPPSPPGNLLGDFAGGALFLLAGVLAALYERERSGQGQTIDASMLEGLLALSATLHGVDAAGGAAVLTGRSPFYAVYECKGGGSVALAAFDPKAYAAFLELTGTKADEVLSRDRTDRTNWPAMRARIREVFRSHDRDWWAIASRDRSGCVAVARDLAEAPSTPQVIARRSMLQLGGVWQATPTPRFSRTQAGPPRAAPRPGSDTERVLSALSMSAAEIGSLIADGVVGAGPIAHPQADPFL